MSLKAIRRSIYIEASMAAMLFVVLLCAGIFGKIPTNQNLTDRTEIQNSQDGSPSNEILKSEETSVKEINKANEMLSEQNQQMEKDSLTQIQNKADSSDSTDLTERKSKDKSEDQATQADSLAVTAEMFSPAGKYQIVGKSNVTVDQLIAYFNESGEKYPAEELAKGGAESIETFCQMYYDEATAEDIRTEVAFAQAMKETGFLQYGGDASIEQFNFAGIGTTGNGVPGNSYPDVQTGIRAQIQHLKAYATEEPLSQECVDERYEYVKKASAPYVQWLGQQENPEGVGWATGKNYGYDIARMIQVLITS